MKEYINDVLDTYPGLYSNASEVLVHMFTVSGNGMYLDHKGWLESVSRDSPAYEFGEPIAIVMLIFGMMIVLSLILIVQKQI